MPRLHSLSGDSRGKVLELLEREISVGRAADNLIRLDEDTVSQHHALLLIADGGVGLRDLNSTNGTCVNGVRIVEAALSDGDRISIGSVEMRFEGPTEEPSAPGGIGTVASEIPTQPPPEKLRHAGLHRMFQSRHHALAEAQVLPDASRCVQCGICSYNCPAGIDVRAHAWRGRAIFDSHCLTCSECVNRCPRGVLRFEVLPLFAKKR